MRKTAYQEIIDKIHFYLKNPNKNPYDVFDYEGDEVEIINKNKDYVIKNKPYVSRRY